MADDGSANIAQMPLAGVVTCCTNIEPERRSEYSSIVSEMGGVNKLDLTSDVTHLIVGGYDTPKYKYVAKERSDVRCVLPTWVEAVREAWTGGFEPDIEALEVQHRVPTFYDTKISMTGFQDVSIRKQIEHAICNNGGEYRGDLTKEVTHLVARTTTGPKYLHAKQWGVHLVSVEWLQHSIERGMILDEALYDPSIEASERGKGAWIKRSDSTISLGKRAREDSNTNARKLRRTASAKFNSQSEALWGDIIGGAFARERKTNESDENANTAQEKPLVDVPSKVGTELAIPRPNTHSVKKPTIRKGIFTTKRFYLHGFDAKRTAILEKHLLASDASILPLLEQVSGSYHPTNDESAFIIVPHTSIRRDLPSPADTNNDVMTVNEFWLEKCLHSKSYIDPSANPAYKPFDFPISGFSDLTISSTGFEDIDLLHVGKTVQLLGALYAGTLTKSTSALVCHSQTSSNREKVQYALKWNIPVVKASWLDKCVSSGKLKSFWDHLVYPDRQARPEKQDNDEDEGDTDFHHPKRVQTGTRKRELDYGQGTRMWMRRKSDNGSSEFQTKQGDADTSQPLSTKDLSFRVQVDDNVDDLDSTVDTQAKGIDTPDVTLAQPTALRERSPNSPPKQIHAKVVEKDSLASAISSLLAARQREASAPSAIDTGVKARGGRRKRALLGRASSNLSSRSHFSRASSVDTLNTDGVGTPVDSAPPSGNNFATRDPMTEALFGAEGAEQDNEQEAAPPTTQIEYQEEDADLWRDKVAQKMGWKKQESDAQMAARLQRAENRVVTDTTTGTTTGRRTRNRG